jgi:hypothetical protein
MFDLVCMRPFLYLILSMFDIICILSVCDIILCVSHVHVILSIYEFESPLWNNEQDYLAVHTDDIQAVMYECRLTENRPRAGHCFD